MNLAARRLLLFFFSIVTLASCEDPTEIGIDLQDENQIGTDFTDTITINTGTVLLPDSILSFKTTPAQVGILADPVLGTVKATTYTEVGLGGTDVSFGENPQVDSMVLTLDYSAIFGNKTKPLKINVFRLTEAFQEKASYFTTTKLATEASPLASTTLVPLLYEKKKVFDVDSTAARRLIKVKLPQSLINEFVAQSGKDPLKSQANFEAFFKGLAIAPEGEPASILALNFAADSSKIVLHYKNGNDKKKHTFRFNTSAVSFFTNFESNRAGTPVAPLTQKGDFIAAAQTGNESFIQNNTQLLTKLTIPYLQKFKDVTGTIVINRAELILPVKANSTSALAPPPQLVLYQTNNTNRILKDANGSSLTVQQSNLGQVNGTAFPAVLTYNSEKSRYTLNITSYFQAMLLGKKPNNGLLLAPASVVANQSGGYAITPEIRPYRAIISNTASNKVKLVVYYSKLN